MSTPSRREFSGVSNDRMRRVGASLVGGLAVVLLVIGCGPESVPLEPADAEYKVRGSVQRTGGQQGSFRELVVRHATIEGFRNRDGEIVGMDSMAMPFALRDGIVIEGLGVGTPVEMTFEVRWESDPVLLITRLDVLPEGTEIDYRGGAASESATEEDVPDEDAQDLATEEPIPQSETPDSALEESSGPS